jgi:L-erythro-3,5-diaminohexanoate dehydrogenase
MKKDEDRGAGAKRAARGISAGGDPYGTHRAIDPAGGLPQPAWRLDNDFARLFEGEVLLAVETLNIDAASFAQMEDQGRTDDEIAHIILRTVGERGKQHNPVTGSGGMLLGRVVQVAPGRPPIVRILPTELCEGDRVATLISLSLTPLRIDRIHAVRRASAQVDVDGEAVFFASSPYARLPGDLPEKVALAALDVAGAAPQVARLVKPGDVVVVLGAGGKSGILCAIEARRRGGPSARIIGVEANEGAAADLRALDCCDVVAVADARDPIGVRRVVLDMTAGREADITFSCVNVPDAETAAILATRERGVAYFFAMSTSFTKAALGAEGVGKDIDLFIGNGYAHGHAEHTLAMLREFPRLLALFERRYGR